MKSFSHRFPRLFALCIGCLLCLILMLGIEVICVALNMVHESRQPHLTRNYAPGYSRPDPLLGYRPKASVQAASSLMVDGKVVYAVTYSIDEFHRRITPVTQRQRRPQFALFFGDSLTFGEGVEDHQTFPAYFAAFSQSYMPYNYGFHGYGPQQMLARLQTGTLHDEISETDGTLIYLYLPFHVNRAIGNMYVFNKWGKNMPYYTIDVHNTLVKKGRFWPDRPLISLSYYVLGKSQFVKYFNIQFPPILTARHYRLTARIIAESYHEFQRQFASGRFYVILYPRGVQDQDDVENIIPYFKEAGITYFDYRTLFDPTVETDYILVGDGHPSAKAYRTLAERFARDLATLRQEP